MIKLGSHFYSHINLGFGNFSLVLIEVSFSLDPSLRIKRFSLIVLVNHRFLNIGIQILLQLVAWKFYVAFDLVIEKLKLRDIFTHINQLLIDVIDHHRLDFVLQDHIIPFINESYQYC